MSQDNTVTSTIIRHYRTSDTTGHRDDASHGQTMRGPAAVVSWWWWWWPLLVVVRMAGGGTGVWEVTGVRISQPAHPEASQEGKHLDTHQWRVIRGTAAPPLTPLKERDLVLLKGTPKQGIEEEEDAKSEPRLVNGKSVVAKSHRRENSGTPDTSWVELSGTVDHAGVTVWLQGREVYSKRNQLDFWAGKMRQYHAGIHLLALHQSLPRVLQRQHFLTWQPAAHRMLAKALNELQEGRLVLVVGVPDYISWLNKEGMDALRSLGAQQGLRAVKEEAWVLLARKGQGALYETIITARNYSSKVVPPLAFSFRLPRYPERQCPWYKDPEMARKVEFCESFEGYGEMCACERPVHLSPAAAPYMKLEEVIPVALVTARRFPMVARQVRSLWEGPGGGQTPLVMLVDGENTEGEALAGLLNITLVTHNNPGIPGTKQRVNEHIKFSLQTMFKLFPKADKVIILEDDLVLAKDFISYFQQTSLLMSLDETILCVNAYNYNAFPHTASDPHRIYRVQSYPYYGWMTSRRHAARMLTDWVPLDQNADWDLYARFKHLAENLQIIIPEIPRTRHEGGGGVHVSGLEQEVTYSKRPLNTLPQPIINMRRHWDLAYAVDFMATILKAKVVKITIHPCFKHPIPRYQPNTTHVIYINLSGENEENNSYKVLAKCLGFYAKGLFEHYRGTYSLKFFETPLILVSCYASVYCDNVPRTLIFNPPDVAVELAGRFEWRHTNESSVELWRVPPKSLQEEVSLENISGFEVMLKA